MRTADTRLIRLPETSAGLIRREKLLSLLDKNRLQQAILFSSPAGYGKTSLLLQFIENFDPRSYIWIQGSENIFSPFTLIRLILIALTKAGYAVNDSLYSIVETYEAGIKYNEKLFEEITEQLLSDVNNLELKEFKLIIDDYQLIEQNEHSNKVNDLISKFLKHKIPGLTVILSSREEFNFPTAKLEAKRSLLKIQTDDLIFSQDEIRITALEIYNIELNDEETCQLQAAAGGWISAVHLILQKGRNWHANLEAVKKEDIFRYFSEDIFSGLSDEIKHFITVTALLDSFTAKESDTLLNLKKSEDILKLIIRKKVFIESYYDSNGETRYLYQKLFREFLTANSGIISADIYLSAAAYCKVKNDHSQYIHFLLKADKTEAAAEFFRAKSQEIINNNNFYLYNECLRQFTDAENHDKDHTFYHTCRLSLFRGEDISGKLESLVSLSSPHILPHDITLLFAEYYFFTNRYREASNTIAGIKQEDITDAEYRYIRFLLARIFFRMGAEYYGETIKICIEETKPETDNQFKIELYGLLGNIYNDEGNITLAIRYYESALNHTDGDYLKYIKQTGNLAELYSITGEYEKAFRYFEKILKVSSAVNIPSLNIIFSRIKYDFYSNIGDFRECIRSLNDSINTPAVQKNEILLITKYLELTEAYWNRGQPAKAKDAFSIVGKLYSGHNIDYFNMIIPFFEQFYADNSEDFNKTEEILLNVISWHKANNIKKPLGFFLFYLSELYLKNYAYNAAGEYLRLALEELQKYNSYSFLENRTLRSRKLFDYGLSNNICVEFIKNITARFLTRRELGFISEEFAAEIDEKIEQITDVKFCCFNSTEFYLRGGPINEDKWIRKKSKILLAYLMSDPAGTHTKDEIIDMFFEDMPADKADTAYHSALYNIRTALKVYEISSEKPKRSKDKTNDFNPQYILYEDKALRLNPDFYYTSANIEFEKLSAKSVLPSLMPEEKIRHLSAAVEMYKGDFMQGYYDSWCEELRVKYKNMFSFVCEELIKLLESAGRYDEVVRYSGRSIEDDKLSEAAHLSIINAYSQLGNTKMAHARYQLMLKIFDEELGEKPSGDTLNKINIILAGNIKR